MRGGRRIGAGRKPVLDVMARFAVGAHCERLWREAWTATAANRNVQQEWEKARAVPVLERAAWRETHAGQEYLEDVRFALQQDQGIDPDDDREPARVVRITTKRPKGQRRRIIEHVAANETVKRGIAISPRLVRECWEEFRAAEKRLDD